MSVSLQSWALPRLQPLLPLPEEDLLQAISYAASLPSAEQVGSHFKDFLGDSSDSLSFISDFNARLFPQKPTTSTTSTTTTSSSSKPTPVSLSPWNSDGPSGSRRGKKVNSSLTKFAQAPRKANDGVEGQFRNPNGAYTKKREIEDEYYTGSNKSSRVPTPTPPGGVASDKPHTTTSTARHLPAVSKGDSSSQPTSAQQSSATGLSSSKVTGTLTSDLINVKTKKPRPQQQKIHVTGGTSMRGVSKDLDDLDSALRTLEISTNPTLQPARRKCTCMGFTHEVLVAAPNCLSCGKIICIKEGLGPCTFCGAPLISADEIQSMVRALRDERGREKMAVNAAQNKRAEVGRTQKPFSTPTPPSGSGDESEGLAKAMAHRDRLLGFQANNAQRTKIIDQAADFDTPTSAGLNPWATPQERALQLKKQQKVMRMVEWNAKEDYEKRRVVVAIDLKGRKIVKEMRDIAPPEISSDENGEAGHDEEYNTGLERGGQAAFGDKGKGKKTEKGGQYAKNPLLRGMIRPVYDQAQVKGKERDVEEVDGVGTANTWRRVQDEFKDNEEVILNGGAYGGEKAERGTVGEEPACG